MLVISEMGYSQVRRPVNPRPRPTPVGPIDPFLPPYAPSRCAVDFVAHRIRVTKISNTRFRYQAYVRNQGTATYTTASNASGPGSMHILLMRYDLTVKCHSHHWLLGKPN
ncbi:MAG: hypothetical protein IPQ04_05265 [Saprospiraceae bacterium]|nr:hypothetical protein [Saprospiraceae bacterium]